MRRVKFPSLGARLTGLFLVLAVAVAVTFLFGLSELRRGGWRETLHPLVMNYSDMLVAEIGSPPDVDRARALAQHLPLRIRIEGPAVNWDSADEPRPEPPAHGPPPPGPRPPPRPHPVVTMPDGQPLPLVLPGPRRAMTPPTPASMAGAPPEGPTAHDAGAPPPGEHPPGSGPRPPPPHRLSLHADFDPSDARVVRRLPDGHRVIIGLSDFTHDQRAQHIGWATLAVLLLLTAVAYAVVRQMLHPVVALRAGAVRYGQGDFSQPIVPRHRDELGDLAEQVNAMAARLHHMLEAKRELLLAISHELRSPLARARLNAELIDESPERGALLRDLGEMRDLISDLLESERLAGGHAGGHAALHVEPTPLAAIVRLQCEAQAGRGEVVLQLDDTLADLPLDRARMRLLVRNLVDNALRHGAGAGRPPVVGVQAIAGDPLGQRLRVRDFGPGMDDAQIAHAAEAFYRADAARQRSTGGVGLGLYLCRLVAQAHGGTLVVRNAHPGLEIDVTLSAASTLPAD